MSDFSTFAVDGSEPVIKLITFDLDDTLWDNGPVIRRAVQEGYDWLLSRCPELVGSHDVKTLDRMKDEIKSTMPGLVHRISESRVVGMKKALINVGYGEVEAEKIAREAFDVFHHWRHKVDFFDGVEETLSHLAKQYPLAVITNGNADVNKLGLGEYFEFCVNSEDMNRSKPDPVMFQRALDIAGIAPENTVHIGDNLISDVRGAAEVGMKTIWFNPDQTPLGADDLAPDFMVLSLSEIPCKIEILEK